MSAGEAKNGAAKSGEAGLGLACGPTFVASLSWSACSIGMTILNHAGVRGTDAPLAVCDARSMRDDDFSACDLVYPDRVGQTHIIQHKPRHRWMYYSRQSKDEVLLLKCWDSERDREGQARYTAHTVSQEELQTTELVVLAFWSTFASIGF